MKALFETLELPLLQVLAEMERNGVRVDVDMLRQQSRELAERMQTVEQEAHQVAGEAFNLGSPKQIQAILYDKQQLPVLAKTPKGAPSTAEAVLQELALDYPLPRLILGHRSLSKLKSTYTDKLPGLVNPRHRAGTYVISSGGRSHRSPVVFRSESAEHPDAYHRKVGVFARPSSLNRAT